VFAISNPFGLDQSLTTGIISALKRPADRGGREITNVIQTDAAINPGNSGDPLLLDPAGAMIGVNTAILSPSGTSAGIGVCNTDRCRQSRGPEIIRRGFVPRPASASRPPTKRRPRTGIEGVVIVNTVPGSAAERAGLRALTVAPAGSVT
jgi:2-alkenal reductase